MPAPAPPSIALSAVTILATVAVGFAIAHAAAREARRNARARARGLESRFEGFLAARVTAFELRYEVRNTESVTFWTALEALSLRLKRPEWRRLSKTLGWNRHADLERRALEDDSPWRRELAARRLALISSSDSRAALRTALARGPEIVTLAAATGLARARDAGTLRWILENPRSLGSRGPGAWSALLRGFGRGAAPVLASTLEAGTGDRTVERALVETLGYWRFRDAASAIVRRLTDSDLEIRVAAARALGRLEASECAGALLAALEDEAWQVRAQASWALGRARAEGAVPKLAACLSDRSWWVRRHAAYALSTLGAEGESVLRRAVATSDDPYARDIAGEVLAGGNRLRA